ncbi:ABC-F family ATP-binding cassette domain-containing protein [Enterococcus camelliae]|uniref:ABC-F family ATP-binding cassette domain-containing protein n=1 Tax=Enterococcus camelliae TaxID=453959 RepID=A0ABW5TIN1_9ENTE
MKELKVNNLNKTFGEKTLFQQLSFLIHEKDRIGLIGVNGTGKSSLLRVLAGLDSGDGDRQTIFVPKDYRIGFLAQETELDPSLTVLDAVFHGDSDLVKTVRSYEKALLALSEAGENLSVQKAYTLAEQAMNEKDAWLADTNAKSILHQLGLRELQQTVSELSGGQKKRLGLAQVLIDEPDLLLLDEPTNHLDYDAITWLEGYLSQYKGALMMVTHDRYFLDRVANRMFELSNGQLMEYQGNYESYVAQRAERDRIAQDQETKRMQLYKQELAWMRAGAKARSTKQQARIQRFEKLEDQLHQVQSKEAIAIDLETKRLGKKVIELKDVTFSYEKKAIVKDFSLLVQTHERLGITGENGAGKSTLLSIMSGAIAPQAGVVEIGETVRLAYYQQQGGQMDPEKRMIAYLQEIAEEVRRVDGTSISVTELLEQFLFPRSTHGTKIGKLSGGERRRLYLLRLLIEQPNVLLLDEPTNDLDIDTLTVLEDYLSTFPGAIITVSHDRYFLDKVAEKLLIFKGNAQIDSYFGSIRDYLTIEKKGQQEETPVAIKEAPREEATSQKKKLTYLEQKEWETIEEEIAQLEEQIERLKEEMLHQGSDFTKLQSIQTSIDQTTEQLDQKYARWEYLSDYV